MQLLDTSVAQQEKNIYLVGNPNAGKTLLFNTLTGLSAKVANYPGVTVDIKRGKLTHRHHNFSVTDLPGTYSLHPRSEDEEIAVKNILGLASLGGHQAFVVVVDATNLERNLFLVSQLIEQKLPFVIALTMMDIAKKNNLRIDITKLSGRIGAPIIPVSGRTGLGIEQLKDTISALTTLTPISDISIKQDTTSQVKQAEEHYSRVSHWLNGVVTQEIDFQKTTDSIDRIALHPIAGPIIMLGIFSILFMALFAWSQPIVEGIENFNSMMSDFISPALINFPLLNSLVSNGIIAGVGAVLAFVPLLAILFLFLGILEDSGYLARATFLLDQAMSFIGLPTKAFVPLLSGFACTVPAIMATRVIESKKDRILTILISPLMSCSARLPVYGLMIATIFSGLPPIFGIFPVGVVVLTSLYLLGIIVACVVVLALRRFYFKGSLPPLVLELPLYRMPRWNALFKSVLDRLWVFIKEAGTIILAMSVLIWGLLTFPLPHHDASLPQSNRTLSSHLEHSYAGQLGHLLEPIIEPLGFDWKIGVGLVASFTAREVMVSTLGVIYGLGEQINETNYSLKEALKKDINPKTNKPVYSPLVALSLLVFFAVSMQCMSTLAVTKKETKSWKWPAIQLGYLTVLAWICSFTVFQVGSLLGFA